MYRWIGKWTSEDKGIRRCRFWLSLVPRPCVLLFCRLLSWTLSVTAKDFCRRVERNMGELLPVSASISKRRRHYLFNVCTTLYELLVDSARLTGSQHWRFQAEGEGQLQEALALGRGAILYTPHVGNFFYYYWYLSQKYPCLTVVTAKSAELRPLYLLFQRMGCNGLDYDETPPLALVKTLRRHLAQNGVVLLMGDFWRPEFPPAQLFGRTTRLPQGAAKLALEGKVPVLLFYGYRVSGFRHRLVFAPPLFLAERYGREQAGEAMKPLHRFVELVVRKVPEQWLYWFNVDERWAAESRNEQEVS
jgi:lauroyl/myristoyl acyltransferase